MMLIRTRFALPCLLAMVIVKPILAADEYCPIADLGEFGGSYQYYCVKKATDCGVNPVYSVLTSTTAAGSFPVYPCADCTPLPLTASKSTFKPQVSVLKPKTRGAVKVVGVKKKASSTAVVSDGLTEFVPWGKSKNHPGEPHPSHTGDEKRRGTFKMATGDPRGDGAIDLGNREWVLKVYINGGPRFFRVLKIKRAKWKSSYYFGLELCNETTGGTHGRPTATHPLEDDILAHSPDRIDAARYRVHVEENAAWGSISNQYVMLHLRQ